MKTLYLREKKSGNFEFSNRKNFTHKFTMQTIFANWYKKNIVPYSAKIIKATYSQSQTYFTRAEEVILNHKKIIN